ncbi:hypothetical protein VCHA35O135_10637 [Vibrio chagasii]|nr:hypothetical protein VCHA35O135_10637 [Vibrio chagasii]
MRFMMLNHDLIVVQINYSIHYLIDKLQVSPLCYVDIPSISLSYLIPVTSFYLLANRTIWVYASIAVDYATMIKSQGLNSFSLNQKPCCLTSSED